MSDKEKIFLAGATGAVGSILSRLLSANGHTVFGMTRKKEKAAWLASINVEAVILNVYEKQKLEDVIVKIKPDIIIHQLTDLPFGLPKDKMKQAMLDNEKIRDIGTGNLISAAKKISIKRFIAQSVSFMYQDGQKPHLESHKLASPALVKFENQVLNEKFSGIILRYGRFYGPGSGFAELHGLNKVHVEAAARAACLAIKNGSAGIYNIAEDDGEVSIDKARRELKWDPCFV